MQNKVITTALSGKANTADLATVATSGSYADLENKPTIPEVLVVTITSAGDDTYTADHTYAEIHDVWLSGNLVLCRYLGYFFMPYYLSTASAVFTIVSDLYVLSRHTVSLSAIKISSSNVVSYYHNIGIQLKDNLVTEIDSASTDTKYPSAKAVYNFVTSTETDTTYTLSMSGNVITLTPSSGTATSITLPVYNGGIE